LLRVTLFPRAAVAALARHERRRGGMQMVRVHMEVAGSGF
jgi:hypothetical protein